MGINKVIYDGDTLVDLTGDNVQPENVEEGVTFHDASGEQRSGTLPRTVSADNVYFSDGETFQQKYEEGELRGPDGADGPQGPQGPDGAPGYTPIRGTDYWTAADQTQIVADAVAGLTQAVFLTSLPASGTTLTANAEYRVSDTVGTYQFTFPDNGDVYVRFTTAATYAISFAVGTRFLGAAPEFAASTTYELMARDGVVAVGKVVTA